MSKPIIVYPKRSNDFADEIVLTKAELQRIVDTAYSDGHKDGGSSKPAGWPLYQTWPFDLSDILANGVKP